jgi:hypothetical protein
MKKKHKQLVKAAHEVSRILHAIDSDEAQDLANELETVVNKIGESRLCQRN